MKRYNVAILGATGAVGREMMKVLEERQFPIAQLKLLASSRSAGSWNTRSPMNQQVMFPSRTRIRSSPKDCRASRSL